MKMNLLVKKYYSLPLVGALMANLGLPKADSAYRWRLQGLTLQAAYPHLRFDSVDYPGVNEVNGVMERKQQSLGAVNA